MIKAKFIYSMGFLAIISLSCTNKFQTKPKNIPIIDLQEFEKITNGDATLYLINFWATWCKPCVEELPYFEKINKKYAKKGLKTILVSLDFKEDYNEKLVPYVLDNELKSDVYLLDAGKPKYWIDKINESWSGAIPATIIRSSFIKASFFKEGELSLKELEQLVDKYLKEAVAVK